MKRDSLIWFILLALVLEGCTPSAGQGESTAPPPPIVTITSLPPTPIVVATATTVAVATVPVESPTAAPTSRPAVSLPVSATLELALDNGLKLYTVPAVRSGTNPTYTITTETPLLDVVDSDPLAAFNQQVATLVNDQVAGFMAGIQGLTMQYSGFGSSFDLRYEVMAAGPGWLSLRFSMSGYVDGAAHPYHYTTTLTYDLVGNRAMSLADLFLPGAAYLDRIANSAIQQLQLRPEFLFPEGAAASEENYRNWNITPEGLLITFDEYQVGPYAAGAQTVVIPYGELNDLINPAGPLVRLTE